jgi:hypothetical protein
MPVKPEAKSGEKQVSEAAFLKSINKDLAVAKAAAKKERPKSALDGEQIAKVLGLELGQRYILSGQVATVSFGFAKDDANRKYFRFAYSLTENGPSGSGIGQIVSNYHELTEGKKSDGTVFRTKEKAYENLYYELQGLGEDTEAYTNPDSDALKAAKHHTAAKTAVNLAISYTKSAKDGKNYVNFYPQGPIDNSDLNTGTDTDTEGEESEEFDPSAWVGTWITWTDSEGSVDFKVEKFDDEGFYGSDSESEYGPAPFAEVEYIDPQPE